MYVLQSIQLGSDVKMDIIISNTSNDPIYKQIKEQIKEQIISKEIQENEILPSLRSLAQDLKISVLTTTKAYNELEQEGFITSRQGKGFYVMSRSSELIKEQFIKEIESNFANAILLSKRINMTNIELINLLKLLMEEENE